MADATMPTAGTHHPGHVPFWLRARRAMQTPGRLVRLVAIDGDLVTIDDDGTSETLWTHPPAVRALSAALEAGVDQLSRFGTDIFIMQGLEMSLVNPARASRCGNPETCGHGRLISVRTGQPWDIADTLHDREEHAAGDHAEAGSDVDAA